MGTLPKKGEIGIRCAQSRSTLWFHLPVMVSTDPDLNTTGYDELTRQTDRPALWSALTNEGAAIVRGVWGLSGIYQIMLRPNYISVTLDSSACMDDDADEAWVRLIPQIVAIIRTVVGPAASVYRHTPPDRRVPQWYIPLVESLSL